MFYLEIELDGVLTNKRCPKMFDEQGHIDTKAIRAYFEDLGYTVGTIGRVV